MNGEMFAYARFMARQKMHHGQTQLCAVCLSAWRRMNPR